MATFVSQYAEMLRRSPWAIGIHPSQLIEHAYCLSSLIWDDSGVAEFASSASQVRVLGNRVLQIKNKTIPE